MSELTLEEKQILEKVKANPAGIKLSEVVGRCPTKGAKEALELLKKKGLVIEERKKGIRYLKPA